MTLEVRIIAPATALLYALPSTNTERSILPDGSCAPPPTRRQPGALEEALDPLRQVTLVELQRRYVHADSKWLDTQGVPVQAVAGHLTHHPLSELDYLPGALGHRNKLQWRDHAALGVFPANQRLHADHLARAGVYLGLVAQFQFVVAQSVAQLLFHL